MLFKVNSQSEQDHYRHEHQFQLWYLMKGIKKIDKTFRPTESDNRNNNCQLKKEQTSLEYRTPYA